MSNVHRMTRWWMGVTVGLATSIATAGPIPERAAALPVGFYLASAIVFGTWHSNGVIQIRKSPLPITAVPIGKDNRLKGTTLRINGYRMRIPFGSSVRVDLSEKMHMSKQPAVDVSYMLNGHKKVVKRWFHATQKTPPGWSHDEKMPPVPKGDVIMLGVDGRGYKPGYPKPGPAPSSYLAGDAEINGTGYIWDSRFILIPAGATDIMLHCSRQAVPAPDYDLRIWSPEFARGYMIVLLFKDRLDSSYPDTQRYILLYSRNTKNGSTSAHFLMHMMMTGMREAGYTPSAAKKMILTALASLTRESGYDLEVAGVGACAEKLAKIRNPMAALRMAWLTLCSYWMERRIVKVELLDGEVVLYKGNVLGSFHSHRFDAHHRYLRQWGGTVVFPHGYHVTKAKLKALALAAQVYASIRYVKQPGGSKDR